jgi:predicted transcriptional regulator
MFQQVINSQSLEALICLNQLQEVDSIVERTLTLTNVMKLKPNELNVFVAERHDLLINVWKGLIRHNFMSCPVLQKKKHRFYGFIDLADIVNYFVEQFGQASLNNTIDFLKLIEADERFQTLTVDDLLKHPVSAEARLKFTPVHKTFSLYYAFELMARDLDIQRLPIVDSDLQLKNLITQSHLLDYVKNHLLEVGNKRFKPVSGFLVPWRGSYVTIKEMEATILGFKRMTTNKQSIVGVVKETTGELTSIISLKDLQIIVGEPKMFSKLFMCACSFVDLLKDDPRRPTQLVTVQETTSLEFVIQELCKHSIHNVFVTDIKGRPLGVLTLKHVLHEILFDEL